MEITPSCAGRKRPGARRAIKPRWASLIIVVASLLLAAQTQASVLIDIGNDGRLHWDPPIRLGHYLTLKCWHRQDGTGGADLTVRVTHRGHFVAKPGSQDDERHGRR